MVSCHVRKHGSDVAACGAAADEETQGGVGVEGGGVGGSLFIDGG